MLLNTKIFESLHIQNQNRESISSECSFESLGSYNLNMHIAAVFIVFSVSGFGIFISLFLASLQSKNSLSSLLQLLKMFGIGVIAGTVWIHLLPEAFSQFSSPCLTGFWTIYGSTNAGIFALLGAFFVHVIELICGGHSHHEDQGFDLLEQKGFNQFSIHDFNDIKQSDQSAFHMVSTQVQAVILEFGILLHSFVIGLTLGVTPDSEFSSLLIAVCFHQMFEGIALGVLVANARLKQFTKMFLGALYTLTTPLGISIGIGVRDSFNSNSLSAIVIIGVLNSLSAGILMYNTYCELVSQEVNHNKSFSGYSNGFKTICLLFMYSGAVCMGILALWA